MKNNFLKAIALMLSLLLMVPMLAGCEMQGPAGEPGTNGTDGANGKSAYELAVENGYTGTLEQWLSSLIGATGEDGAKGEKGDKGDTGAQGEKGDTGATGNDGEDGITPQLRVNQTTNMWEVSYDKGETWTSLGVAATGAQGEKGDKGDTGAQGEKGDKGDTGAQGEKGDKGDTGAQGEKGDKGDTGAQGEKGDKGDTGAQGEKGDKGDTGAQGDPGVGVDAVYIKNNHLIVVLSNGDELDAGQVIFPSDIYIDAPEDSDVYVLNDVDLIGVRYVVLVGDWSEKTLTVECSYRTSIEIESDGDVQSIVIDAPRAEITLNEMTVGNLIVGSVAQKTLTLKNSSVDSVTIEKGHLEIAENSVVNTVEISPVEEGAETKLTVSSDSATVVSVTVNTTADAEAPRIVVEENARIETIVANNDQNDIGISGNGEIGTLEITSTEKHIVVSTEEDDVPTISEKKGIGTMVAVVDRDRKEIFECIDRGEYPLTYTEDELRENIGDGGNVIALGDLDPEDDMLITVMETIELPANTYIDLNGVSISCDNGPVFRVTGENVVIAGKAQIISSNSDAIIVESNASLVLNEPTVRTKYEYVTVRTSGKFDMVAGYLMSNPWTWEEWEEWETWEAHNGRFFVVMEIEEDSEGAICLWGGSLYGHDPKEYLAPGEDLGVSYVCHEITHDVKVYTVCTRIVHVETAEEFIDTINMNIAGLEIHVDKDIYFNESVVIRNTTYIKQHANIYFSAGGFVADGTDNTDVVEVHVYGASKKVIKAGPGSALFHATGTDAFIIARYGWATYTGTPVENVEDGEVLLKATCGGVIKIWSGHFDNTYNRNTGLPWYYTDEDSKIEFADGNIGGTANVIDYDASHNPIYTDYITDRNYVEEQIKDGGRTYKFFVSTTEAWYTHGYIGAGDTANIYIKKPFVINEPIREPGDPADTYYLDLNVIENFYALCDCAFVIEEEGRKLIIEGDGTIHARAYGIRVDGGELEAFGSFTIETDQYQALIAENGANVYMSGTSGTIKLSSPDVAVGVANSRVHFETGVSIEAGNVAMEIDGPAPEYDENGEWICGTWVGLTDVSVSTEEAQLLTVVGGASVDIWGENGVYKTENSNIGIFVFGAALHINGGTFLNCGDTFLYNNPEDDSGYLGVESGSFQNYDPVDYLDEGYCSNPDENGYYIVTAIQEAE